MTDYNQNTLDFKKDYVSAKIIIKNISLEDVILVSVFKDVNDIFDFDEDL